MRTRIWTIEDLSNYPQWFNQVVSWHHAEWLRNTDDANFSVNHIADKLVERQSSMRSHLGKQNIPTTFVALLENRPIGSVSLIDYPSSLEPERVWLTNLFVDLPFQHKGVGSDLLKFAERFARLCVIPELSLYTFDAKDYYLERGWRWLSAGELHGKVVDVFSKKVM